MMLDMDTLSEVNEMNRISIEPDWVFSPQPMYVIGTRNEDGTPNFCIITWLGFSFDRTPHLMMTMDDVKQTKTNILREKAFSACKITEQNLWLADYFGCTKGEDGPKDAVPFTWQWGEKVPVPVIDDSPWVYECRVDRVLPLDGAHLFLAEIVNIQIDRSVADMDRKHIDLTRLRPTVYAPYQYFSIGEKLGEMGQWPLHIRKTDGD